MSSKAVTLAMLQKRTTILKFNGQKFGFREDQIGPTLSAWVLRVRSESSKTNRINNRKCKSEKVKEAPDFVDN